MKQVYQTAIRLFSSLLLAVGLMEATASNVLILYDDSPTNTNTLSLKTALENAGHTVTISGVTESSYDGTNPTLSTFDAVIHLNGTSYAVGMPTAGQLALVDFVENTGGKFVGFEWNAYEHDEVSTMTSMTDLILFVRTSGVQGSVTYNVVSGQEGHPVLMGIPSSFVISTGTNIGGLRTFSTQPSTLLMTEGTNAALAVRDFGNGSILNFHHSGNYQGFNALSDTNVQQIIINFLASNSVGAEVTHVKCAGGSTGAITLNPEFGIPPYSYLWNTGDTTQSLSGLSAGTYTVTVTDSVNETVSQTIFVNQPDSLIATVDSVQNLLCYNGGTGVVIVSATGGNGSYTFTWSNAATGDTISGLNGGTYTLTVTDDSGCVHVSTVEVDAPEAITATLTVMNVSCFGLSDGGITSLVTGGTSPYTYEWNNAETTANLSGLTIGLYTLTVTDSNDCTADFSAIVATPFIDTSVTVGTTGLAVTLTANANATGTSYQWLDCSVNAPISGATDATFEPAANGSYAVAVTEGGCTDTSACFEVENVGISPISTAQNITLFPNPTSGSFSIRFGSSHTSGVNIEIVDAHGKLVYKSTLDSVTEGHTETINAYMAAGIYTVKAMSNNGVVIQLLAVN